jgi:hypothetical protein
VTFPWKIEVRDADLSRVGELDDYQSLDLLLKFNDVSTWSLKIDRSNRLAHDITQPGAGIIVSRNGTAVLSGEWDRQSHRKDEDANELTLSGVDDTDWLRQRLAHPQPLSTAPPYSTTAEDVRTQVASNVMRQFVGVNIAQDGGTPAIPPRIKAGLTRLTDPAYGPVITGRGRWQNLLVLLQELAVQGAVDGLPVGFRVVQVSTGLQYQGYVPVDRTATAVFSEGRENLRGFSYDRVRPKANYWFVGGSGTGTARTIYEHVDSPAVAQWGRREDEFVDASSAATAGELQQAGIKAAADDSETHALSVTPIDTDQLSFGVHYFLGDRVTAVLDVLGPDSTGVAGDVISDVLRECRIQITPNETTVTPAIGTDGAHAAAAGQVVPTRMFQLVRDLKRRMTNQERG